MRARLDQPESVKRRKIPRTEKKKWSNTEFNVHPPLRMTTSTSCIFMRDFIFDSSLSCSVLAAKHLRQCLMVSEPVSQRCCTNMKSIREIWKLLCERSEKSQQLQKIQSELDAKIPMQCMRLDKDVHERSFQTLNSA